MPEIHDPREEHRVVTEEVTTPATPTERTVEETTRTTEKTEK